MARMLGNAFGDGRTEMGSVKLRLVRFWDLGQAVDSDEISSILNHERFQDISRPAFSHFARRASTPIGTVNSAAPR